ncbi:MAG: hypothetical protein RLZZ67_136 [Candidatus Parcubacteria bacterium]|jgi:hypothetical protein
MKLVQYRKDWLQSLVDAILFVFDCMAKLFVWLVSGALLLSKQGIAEARSDPKKVYAIIGGPLITYVGLGMIRCLSVILSNNPTIYYMPVLDWWWVYLMKLLH